MTQELLIEFCLRLAAGLACAMLAVLDRYVGRQFFRTIMLVILGLVVLARLNWSAGQDAVGILLIASGILSFLGFALWTLGRNRAGGYAAAVIALSTWGTLAFHEISGKPNGVAQLVALANAASSAVLLGSMVGAMLLGHTYLISPAMSIDSLRRLVIWIAGAIGCRVAVSAVAAAFELRVSGTESVVASVDPFWWLMVAARGVIGLIGPSIIAWMAWQTVRIRSTQSATGILYAGVILVFFGELLGEFLGI